MGTTRSPDSRVGRRPVTTVTGCAGRERVLVRTEAAHELEKSRPWIIDCKAVVTDAAAAAAAVFAGDTHVLGEDLFSVHPGRKPEPTLDLADPCSLLGRLPCPPWVSIS